MDRSHGHDGYRVKRTQRREPTVNQRNIHVNYNQNRSCTFMVIGVLIVLFLLVLAICVVVLFLGKGSKDPQLGPGPVTDPPRTQLPTDPPEEVCVSRRTTSSCSETTCEGKYRTYDGTCNNQRYPLWGASEIPFKRLIQPIYEDRRNTPVGWDPNRRYNGYRLPNAREVSQEVMSTPRITQNPSLTDLMMVWGQYLDHDIDQIPKTNSLCTESCTKKSPYCFPVLAPENDPRLDEGDCIPLTRSTRVCDLEPREQLNSITAYLDAGVKYGSTEDRARALRDLTNENGHMKEGVSVDAYGRYGKPLLPFNIDNFPQGCNRPRTDTTDTPCFFSGDVRANEHLGLIALHTVWNREHNRIADELKIINPLWNGETLYQEARKIVGALHQKITFEHWLPKTVGNKGIELLGEYTGYNPYVDASVGISFATATFRFGHAQISPTVIRLGSDFREAPYGNLPLHETAFCPAKIVYEGGTDSILRGMYGTAMKDINPQSIMTEEITESLFQLTRDIGLDLASLNIQRGRDHGLPGYNEWRRFCNLPVAYSFDDLAGEISDPNVRQHLQELYGHPSNVDLFVGGLAEDPWYDSLVGPTFTCLIVEQFRRLRDGDRFWYENPGVFTTAQLEELKKHTLSRVICDSGDYIAEIQDDVFDRASYPYDYKSCDQIPSMDLSTAWKDTGNGRECPTFPVTPPPTATPTPEEVCLTPRTTATCSQTVCEGKYRTYDGTCNNQRNPLWGASEIPFKRLREPIYEDGRDTPVGWDPYRRYNGYRLPNAREVSQEVMSTSSINQNPIFTDLMMVWGQYLDHDIDQIPKTNSLCTESCTKKSPYCFPVLAPENDPRLDEGDCIPLTRSTRVCDLEPREQLNSITAYLDAGVKYGSTEDRALALRDLTNENGHLKEGVTVEAYGRRSKSLLPYNVDNFPQGCNRPRTDTTGTPCFFSGDVRANEHLGLIALHTVWNREHNRIADELKIINPLWNGETLYQEARKIVGALHQKITFEHWLPRTVGNKGIELLGGYTGYNPYVDASVGISFATATFRFGHAQISPTVIRLGSDFREAPYGNLPLHETAFCPAKIVYEGGTDSILRGMYGTAMKDINPQNIMTEEITESLFQLTRDIGLDLASINIQRGRDHGLPGYNEWRRFCNLPVAYSFDDLAGEISDPNVRQNLQELYGHPSNVDLFVGGLAEDPWYDSLVGPTFTCLIVEQFKRLRDGDRFWYENPGVFTTAQLEELKKHTLSRVICDSGDYITEIQDDVFDRASYPYDYKSCDQVPSMDLSTAWKDTGNGRECPTFPVIPPPTPTPAPEEICLTPRTTATCSQTVCESKYRTYDGTCNNQRNPLWGASEIPFKRLKEPIYEDGRDTPVGWDPYRRYNGYRLPNVREVSQEVMSTSSINQNPIFTDLMMVWGQYLDHDIDQIPKTNSLCTESCTKKSPYCFPVLAPENDPRLDEGDCIPLTRSTRVCDLEPREQLNSITAYLDAGVKYGSTEDRALALRDLTNENGHLKEGVTVDAYGRQSKRLLPYNVDNFPQGCNRPRTDTTDTPCFFSGDVRANEHLGLIALHTVWNREHNRIADELKIINPVWNGETLYQEARKIVGALHQKITFEHWLPRTVGNKGIELLGGYTGYNPYVDASVGISFATATFRFGHAQISPTVIRLGSDFREAPYGNLPLHETAFCPAKIVYEGGTDSILRGMYGTAMKDINPQSIMTEEITESLFQLTRDIGLDLASLNIQRGRDHGLPGYNEWRRFCNLPVAYSFDDLAGDISDSNLRRKLQELYGHPSNVDLFVGGLAEDPWYDSLVGPTFTCLIVEQFRRLRDGDRFWYENPGVFTPAQLIEIKKHSLGRVFCDSADNILKVQDDVFDRANYPYDYNNCDEVPRMDLSTAWKDSSSGSECPVFPNLPPTPPTTPVPEEVCLTPRALASCELNACTSKYRSYDGTCNNQQYTLWGASEIPFKRLLDPIYEDGRNTPVGWDPNRRYNDYRLPNAREVSQEIMSTQRITQNPSLTDLMMVWGQYLDHDIDHIPKTNSLCTEGCTQKSPYCFPVFAPENDPRLRVGDCIPVTRSTRVCDVEPRQQLNSITSYIDAGVKYGSTEDRALALRDLTNENGHMKEGVTVDAYGRQSKRLLPYNVDNFPQGCNRPRTDTTGTTCFFSGDVRANEHLGLIALHTVWNREHNRIADELKSINPQWNGETLYQEARKIVGALHQMITYEYWLPKTVGSKGIEMLGRYYGYRPNVDASVSISFATATFRFGHAQISPTVIRLGSDFHEAPYGNLPLHETAFCPAKLVYEGSTDPLLRGMYGTSLKNIDPQTIMTEEITESLFGLTRDVALDLASLNIQRGRDHGLPGYNEWRRFCNLPVAYSFDDLAGEISDPNIRQKLQDLYGHPSNIDLFVGGLAEDPWYDSLVGPTFTCLIVDQFKRLRDGDRFWYENPGVFTTAQLSEIRRHSLARVICDSSDNIQVVQEDVFERASYPFGYKNCQEIPGMNLSEGWRTTTTGNECP
ncbi:uncharacterized protein [Amphiura filiformis]|uniref:uncharacterized protein n=1 Tax=Amphiura filiformis TaxID=82378 RepID=UPI003B218BD0